MANLEPLAAGLLPSGVRARVIAGINGLDMHILEAGAAPAGRPLLLLLHGFPELAYSWRKIMGPLASAGYHVVAPDQRGYGRTTGWSADYDQDLRPFSMLRLAADALALVYALGHTHVAAVIGHDFGSPVAAWCAVTRPDVFRTAVLMSAPFGGTPSVSVGPDGRAVDHPAPTALDTALARLPRPRKHYQRYFATRAANADMRSDGHGLADFLRAYFHAKSADWSGNHPTRLDDGSAAQLARMPDYYVMDLAKTMPENVAPLLPTPAEVAACRWLTEAELAVYTAEYRRTGFQGGLNWYRARFEAELNADLALYANATLDVPSMFMAGRSDWGVYQVPGAYERMQSTACTRMLGCHLIDGAGHWVMQEQPDAVAALLIAFLEEVGAA